VQGPVHRHARIAPQVLGQRRHQLLLAEGVRRDHAQQADRLVAGAADLAFEFLPAGDQLPWPRVAAHAVVGQLHRVGRALQQAHAQRFLQRLEAPADGRLGGLEQARGGRQAAGIDDAHEGFHQHHTVRWQRCRENVMRSYVHRITVRTRATTAQVRASDNGVIANSSIKELRHVFHSAQSPCRRRPPTATVDCPDVPAGRRHRPSVAALYYSQPTLGVLAATCTPAAARSAGSRR
jgi:hypothetical protein